MEDDLSWSNIHIVYDTYRITCPVYAYKHTGFHQEPTSRDKVILPSYLI